MGIILLLSPLAWLGAGVYLIVNGFFWGGMLCIFIGWTISHTVKEKEEEK